MLTNEWKNVEGFSNMGEDYENIAARKIGDVVQMAYMACAGLKVVELTGIKEIEAPKTLSLLDFVNEYGDDWEIGIYVKEDGEYHTVVLDSCGEVGSALESVQCVSTEEYDVDNMDELEVELLKLYDLV